MIINYFAIYEDIIYNYGNQKRNYSILQNINDMSKYNDIIIEDINKIINENNIPNKIYDIMVIFNKMLSLNNDNNIKEANYNINSEENNFIKDVIIINK